ncbi:MAG: DMT family transporter [Spirochaetota bacterium]
MIKDVLYILLSALSFALSTVFAKLVMDASDISAMELTFLRFFAGFALAAVYVAVKKLSLKPQSVKNVGMRSIFNVGAAIFFFLAVEYSTVTKSNILNMTYPIFVFLLAPYVNKEKVPVLHYFFLVLGMAGIYFVVMPDVSEFYLSNINKGDIYGFLSGLLAGFAVAYLREARKYDSTFVILFYHMGIGTLITLALAFRGFMIPHGIVLIYVILTVITSVAGQVFITLGYKSINAAAGSLISCSRILIAALLGVTIFSDPLTLKIIAGGVLITVSLTGVSGIIEGRKKQA